MRVYMVSFSTAMSACEWYGQWKWAMAVLDSRRQLSNYLNVISFSAAISVHKMGRQWPQSVALIDLISFSTAMSACEWCGRWKWA
eukprot:1847281-Karenia_brevis.AAC.1